MSSKPDLADVIFRAFVDRRDRLRAGARAARRSGSSARGTRARRWPCARSRVAAASSTSGSTSRTPTTSTCCSRAWASGPRDTPVVITRPRCCAARRRASSPSTSGSRSSRRPGTCSTSSSSAAGRPGWRPRSTAHRRASTRSRSTPSAPAGRRARARGSRTTSGFPNGISGEELTSRTAMQAQRLGARLELTVRGRRSPRRVRVPRRSCSRTAARCPRAAVIIASGARYQRLAVDDLERFEGAGVYYAATELEVRLCAGSPVVVVGGGNSAGQAALSLAQRGSAQCRSRSGATTSRTACRATSSNASTPTRASRCSPAPRCARWHGDRFLETVTLEHTPTGERRVGARVAGCSASSAPIPSTAWLDGAVALDPAGFVLTDRVAARRRARRPGLRVTASRSRSRRRCPACSRSATSATVR